MPERENQVERSAQKRKTKDSRSLKDGHDSSFVSVYRDFHKPHQNTQRIEHTIPNGECLPDTKQTDTCTVPAVLHGGISLNYPAYTHLKDHMDSVLTEVKEAQEKLLVWMRQEIHAISAINHPAKDFHKETVKRRRQAECSSNTESVGVQAALQGGVVCGSPKLDTEDQMLDDGQDQNQKLRIGAPQRTAVAHEGHADKHRASNGILQTDSELVRGEHNTNIADLAVNSGSGSTCKMLNGMKHGLLSNFSSKERSGLPKEAGPDQNATSKLLVESRNALFGMCFGAGLADDVKDVEGLDGTLESSVTMRESFEFNKANHDMQKGLDGTLESSVTMRESFEFNKASHDMQKGLDGLHQLRETKSALLDMGFDDEGSNEGDGVVGCCLESAASSKAISALSKAGKGIQSGFGGGNDAGFSSRFAEKSKEHTPISCTDAYRPIKAKKEIMMGMEVNNSIDKKELVCRSRAGRPGDESRLVDPFMSTVAASWKGSHIAEGFSAQGNQVGDAYQQACMNARSGCGIKRPYSTAMTFKGSALESKEEGLRPWHENHSYADAYPSATSNAVMKGTGTAQLPSAADRGKVESLALQQGGNCVGISGSAPAWSMFTHTASRNSMDQAFRDAKVAHLEHASRSKLGGTLLGSAGATLNLQGFDPIFSCSPHLKPSDEMMEAYQQEQANSSSSPFSSMCTNSTDYLTPSKRVMGMQRSLHTAVPSSTAALRSMLLGIPGHIGGHHEPSNTHTFLGLGMNGVPTVANGMQVPPGLYLQSNQQNTQVSFKQGPSASSPMGRHRESSGAQEKAAALELKF